MDEFGKAFRKPRVDLEDEERKPLPPLLPGSCSYIPFLASPEILENPKKTETPAATTTKIPETTSTETFISQYIVVPVTPETNYIPGPLVQPQQLVAYEPLPVAPLDSFPPVYIPMPIVHLAPPSSITQYSSPPLSRKQKRNKKKSIARKEKPRPRNETRQETQSIAPDDPYWAPALDKAVVAVNSKFVNRRAKMPDNAEIIVRSFADGTVTAIRDDTQVILLNPTKDSSETNQ